MSKKKCLLCAVLALFVVLALIASTQLFGGSGKAKEPAGAMERVEEPIQCRLWFWGEDEAPGITDFLIETARLYGEQNPDVVWEVTHVDIDQIYTGFYAAVEAKDAPELHILWGGVMGLEPAWAGHLSPISDYVSEETLSHIYPETRAEGYWNGKQWLVPLYLDPWLFAINKDVWRKSGLNPDRLPKTWNEFVAALEKIKAAGFTPWGFGIKDGFYGGWFPSALQYQCYDSATDYHRAVVGDEKLTDPKHSTWWFLIQELRDKGLFNPDVNSLSLAEGQDLFFTGNVGVFYDVQPRIAAAVREMGEDKIDVMIAPVPCDGKLKGKLPIPAIDVSIPKVAKYKEEAGRFLEYFLSSERQNALYEQTGTFPATDWVKKDIMKSAVDRKIWEWVNNNASMTYVWNHPGAFEEAVYAITQEFFAGKVDAEGAARKYEAAAEKWRSENPEAVKNFKIWVEEGFPFMQ